MLYCFNRYSLRLATAAMALMGALAFSGCQSSSPTIPENTTAGRPSESASMVLSEGDVLKISFSGAPNLDTTQTIRRDGKITVDPAGEIQASGLTPHQVETELLDKLGSILVVKQVSVIVQASGFVVYVTGAVDHGGRIVADRRLTPLEAVIEAGYDMEKSNLKRVTVIRETANGQTQKFRLNLDEPLHGRTTQPFVLQPLDIIYVPEKFTWY